MPPQIIPALVAGVVIGSLVSFGVVANAGTPAATPAATTSFPTSEPDATGVHGKPRVILTTDPEKDDQNSFIRYLLDSDMFDTEGLVVTSSQYHWTGDGKGTKWFVDGREYTKFPFGDPCPCSTYRWPAGENHVELGLDAYAKVYPNLRAHDASYPSPTYLSSIYRLGNVDFDGEMTQDTPGSDLIKQVLLDDNPQPVFLLAWGGESSIARALQSIQLQYQHTAQWPAIYAKVSQKAIINASGDQDNTGAEYITPNWPLIRHGGQGSGAQPGGGLGYGAQDSATPATARYYTPAWIQTNIAHRGPLGDLYYYWGDGRQMVAGDPTDYSWLSGYTAAQLEAMDYYVFQNPEKKGSFLGEGDTGTFLSLLDIGMRQDENIKWGRYTGGQYLKYLMDEEAVRLTWSLTPTDYKAVEHPPVVTLQGANDLTAKPGQAIVLTGRASDPDGDALTYTWSQDSSIDTYPGSVRFSSTRTAQTSITVPTDAQRGQTIHLVLQVSDDAALPLARYQRVVITVK